MIELIDISRIYEHEDYIKECCPDVRAVYSTGLYFEIGDNSAGANFSYHGYPDDLPRHIQLLIIKAINAACNTEFVLIDEVEE